MLRADTEKCLASVNGKQPDNDEMRTVTVPFQRWESQDTERVDSLPRPTELVSAVKLVHSGSRTLNHSSCLSLLIEALCRKRETWIQGGSGSPHPHSRSITQPGSISCMATADWGSSRSALYPGLGRRRFTASRGPVYSFQWGKGQ